MSCHSFLTFYGPLYNKNIDLLRHEKPLRTQNNQHWFTEHRVSKGKGIIKYKGLELILNTTLLSLSKKKIIYRFHSNNILLRFQFIVLKIYLNTLSKADLFAFTVTPVFDFCTSPLSVSIWCGCLATPEASPHQLVSLTTCWW